MKKFNFLAMLFLMTSSITLSAQTTLGGRIGVNFSNASVDGLAYLVTPNISPAVTFTGGITINQRIDDRLSVTSGIHYKRKGFIVSAGLPLEIFDLPIDLEAKAETRLDYLEIPLLLNIGFNKGKQVQPYIELGPAFSYALQADIVTSATVLVEINIATTELDLTRDVYNRFEVAGQGVAGIKIPYGKGLFDLGISYTQAFTDMLKDPALNIEIRNNGFGIHAGFAMPLGSDMEK